MTTIRAWLYSHCPPLWRLWVHWRCPLPIGHEKSARACYAAGECGCDNAKRFR